ncbi:unnamed protein product [Rhizopus stolonifer]
MAMCVVTTDFFVFVRRGELLDIDNRISKDIFAYYSCNSICTLYAANTEKQPKYTTSPGVYKVADFTIPMPTLAGVVRNENVDFTVKIYFGEVELRVEVKER